MRISPCAYFFYSMVGKECELNFLSMHHDFWFNYGGISPVVLSLVGCTFLNPKQYVWGVLYHTSSNNIFGFVQTNVESDSSKRKKR
jgi:hypothetical protein